MTNSLAPESLFSIGHVTLTNTMTNTLLVDVLVVLLCYFVSRNITLIPGIFQNMMEICIQAFYDLTETVSQVHPRQIFPFMMSFFIFILIANASELIPVLGAFGFTQGKEFTPLFRSTSTDLNTTLALAFVSLAATHIMSIKYLGLKSYLGRFFSLNPLNLYTGLLELISEFTKIISFSFRLYGNIFVGGVLLSSVTGVLAFVLPVPVLLYELFVGTIQAVVFAMLTMAFMAIMTTPHHEEGHANKEVNY